MQEFLEPSKYIDWQSPEILTLAASLADGKVSKVDVTKSCFEYVRDSIKHSFDYQLNPVTCKASDVLKHKTGFCFAKTHLLAALLRANQIPTALMYQRVAFGEASFYWHGLNAVFLDEFGWVRVDPRGLKEGIRAECCPPHEVLPFTPKFAGEVIFEKRWSEPSAKITSLLEASDSYLSFIEDLPGVIEP